jgi:hypothetical protein
VLVPELAAAYTAGFVACLALTILYVFLRERRRHSDAAAIVQRNLAKLNLYWSDSNDAIVPLTASSAVDEAKRSQRTIGYTGLILSLLSWLGLLFLLMIMLSERFLARSRRERKLFTSPLSTDPSLDVQSARRLIDDLDLLNDSPAEVARTIESEH